MHGRAGRRQRRAGADQRHAPRPPSARRRARAPR
jgi:hypothetical protein